MRNTIFYQISGETAEPAACLDEHPQLPAQRMSRTRSTFGTCPTFVFWGNCTRVFNCITRPWSRRIAQLHRHDNNRFGRCVRRPVVHSCRRRAPRDAGSTALSEAVHADSAINCVALVHIPILGAAYTVDKYRAREHTRMPQQARAADAEINTNVFRSVSRFMGA